MMTICKKSGHDFFPPENWCADTEQISAAARLKELPQLGWFQSIITIHLIGQVKHLTAVTSTD